MSGLSLSLLFNDFTACLSKLCQLSFQVKGGAYTEQSFDYRSFSLDRFECIYTLVNYFRLSISISHSTRPNIIHKLLGLFPMPLRNIFTNLFELCVSNLLELCTGLPSQATFIEKRVVPAKPDDQFCNDRCGICWGDYGAEHPGSKIPCGHIFGLGCIHAMVKSPTGDVCPYCQKKLFYPGLTALVKTLLMQAMVNYDSAVLRMMNAFYRVEDRLMQQVPWLATPLYFLYNGPAGVVLIFVSKFTDIGTRNSREALNRAFQASMLLPMLFHSAAQYAPILLPAYLVFGLYRFIWIFLFLDFFLTFGVYVVIWAFETPFIGQADRATVGRLAVITLVVRDLLVVCILCPGLFSIALRFVSAVLGWVPW
jgi:hypothetical protein